MMVFQHIVFVGALISDEWGVGRQKSVVTPKAKVGTRAEPARYRHSLTHPNRRHSGSNLAGS